MNKDEQTRLQEELDKIVSAIETQESLRGNMPEDVLDGILGGLTAKKEGLESRIAALSGSGAIASGDHATAVGERGIGIDGDMSGHAISGDHNTLVTTENRFYGDKNETDPEKLREWYLRRLIQDTGVLTLEGIDRKAASCESEACLNLDAVYTALLTQNTESGMELPLPYMGDKPKLKKGPKQIPALKQLNTHPKMVLLGDPGGGKTTFVNFVAYCMAGEKLGLKNANLKRLTSPLPDEEGKDEEHSQPWFHGFLIPVRVVLREFAARGIPESDGCASDLWRFIESELQRTELGNYAKSLKEELQGKGGIVFLDGLDEVPEAENRRGQLKAIVEDFIKAFSKCRILITSRIYAYQKQEWRIPGLHESTLAPFSKGQIIRFVDRWYAHIKVLRGLDPDHAQAYAELLKKAIADSPRLAELAKRPLLLTLMASLHAWRGGTLPERREELYADAVDLLLDWWESRKVRKDPGGKIVAIEPGIAEFLKTERYQVRAKLNELAYEAHRSQEKLQGTADIPEKDLVYGLIELSSEKQAIDPRKLIQFLEQRAGLLIQRGGKIYTFPHRTFQEYLAACHLTELDYPYTIADLTRDDPDRWREVALLAGAKAAGGSSAGIWHLADALCFEEPDKKPTSIADFWGGLLAGQALVETANLENVSSRHQSKLEKIRQWQVKILEGDELPAVERAMAGRNLSIMGDPRKAVTTLEHMKFCLVPAGPFHMGSGEDDDEKPYHLNEHMNYDYWISRYPITNAQFEEFVKAGGYKEGHFWAEAKKAGYWESGTFRGDARPRELGSPFNLPNHPVVGVSWYEALAFTRWLTIFWKQERIISEKFQIRLPSEAEWEKAARGGVEIPEIPIFETACENNWDHKTTCISNPEPERKYPWGNQIDKENANYDDTGIGATSAVGCFSAGVSRYGCLDMAGNVWEWTLSAFKDYPYVPGDGREELKGDNSRVLRGGASYLSSGYLRCADRSYYHSPNARYVNLGFRCVCAPNNL